MLLLFKPRESKYLGEGTLSNGSFDDTSKWLPVTRYLEVGAENYPDKTLFRVADAEGNLTESFTYKETNDWANKVANGLRGEFGIEKGDKVGMYMLNCSEYVASIVAIHKAGGVQVPINKDEKGERLEYVINYSDMQALVVDQGSVPFLEEISKNLKNLKTIFVTGNPDDVPKDINGIKTLPFNAFDGFSVENPALDVAVSDMERCMFTSGTTGMPKGVAKEVFLYH